MKIFVIGNTGMLGNYVYKYLKSKDYDIIGFNRDNFCSIDFPEKSYLSYYDNSIIINCVGLIPQRSGGKSKYDYIKANTVFPHKLQQICKKTNSKLIHITTDCVFSGNKGVYSEISTHDCVDIYGRTKSLGEPEKATIIRTSIIGEELKNKKSLLEWCKENKNKEVNGYVNHIWNGITCYQFAKICEEIIEKKLFWSGVKHIYSSDNINKLNLIELISNIYNLNITVKPYQTENKCDRSLISIKDNINFVIPTLLEQIKEQKIFGEKTF